jgi:ADP-ribose pyrophosphatase YjhB (NUDIX family)
LEPTARTAVAAAITRDDGLVLAVRRPDVPGEELPGIWGLPAVTLADGETPEDGVRRIGREKLGCELTSVDALASGEQRREGYALHMTVYAATLVGEPRLVRDGDGSQTLYDAIDWLPPQSFRGAAARGSLCCALFLEATGTRRER